MEMNYPAVGPLGSAGPMGKPMSGTMGHEMPRGIGKGMMQPGMMQPGMMQPGMMQPGMMQPGMMQPGMMQPGMMQPGMMQPGMMQPGMMQPGMMQPGMMQPGMMQPGMTGPEQMPSLMPMQAVGEVLHSLTRSLSDLTLQCGVASVALYIPEARTLPGLDALHKANYEASYHIASAIGAARMILSGSREPGYYAVLLNCQRKTQEALQTARDAFQQVSQAAPQALRPWAQQVGGLLQATSGNLQRSMSVTNAALGPQGTQRVMQIIQQAGTAES